MLIDDSTVSTAVRATLVSMVCALVSGCNATGSSASGVAPAATTEQGFSMTLPAAGAAADSFAVPTFHAAPVILDAPDETDASEPMSSALLPPHLQAVRAEMSRLSSRRLTWQALQQVSQGGEVPNNAAAGASGLAPSVTSSYVATYTPAQIRAAYALPALPVAGSTPTPAQLAQLGAGQTIYIVDAQHDPNAAAELSTFNQKFGLPACAVTSIAPNATLPLPAAPASGCSFSVVYSTSSGGMTASAPAYDSGWATEIALDVQWTHATAPYARIILIEAPDASVNSLSAAVSLANAMGPGVVSQSFGAAEGSWTASFDSVFTAANMTYLAAAGDAGAEVEWPAVSTHVVAVGGTSLTYTGSGPRSEVVWSGTGGGVSQYVATPAYQTQPVVGLGPPAHRAVTDVSFNADPSTGQYVAVMPQGSTSANWMSIGGTSLSTPQWAGILAIANAMRAQNAQALLGSPHAALYQLATHSGSYASDFLDVLQGADGSCATCTAGTGYDLPTGLGTPNVSSLLTALIPPPAAPSSPVVVSQNIAGTIGTPLSFTVSATGPNALAYSVSGAPAGLSINASSGLVSWASPVAGSFSLTITARDTQTGLTGQGTVTVKITAPQPPVVTGTTVSGVALTSLNFPVQVTAINPVTYTLTGAPSGMSVSTAGVVSWTPPKAGSFSVTVVVRDTKTGLSGQGVYTLAIAAAQPPVIPAQAASGSVGKAFSYGVQFTSAHALNFSLSGAPAGVSISSSGVISWATPVAGLYNVKVTATDATTGLSGSGTCSISIAKSGPSISAAAMTGVAGQPLKGTISFSDSTSNSLNITISGIPAGMNLALGAAGAINVSWPSPVAGSYVLKASVTDGNGLTASLNVPVTISAH